MLVRCGADGAVTTATVTIDADDSRLTAVDRLLLLRRLGAHLRLPETLLRLAANHRERPVFDDGPLVAGPGDAKHPTGTTGGLLVQWDVGCGNVFADHMPVLQLLETASANGSLSAEVGHGVIGWDVSSRRSAQSRSKRRVYFANPTATPELSVERPSARPVPTAIVPESRIVPTAWASVGVPGVTRTQYPPSGLKDTSIIAPAVRLTKSPTPTTTYVTITATRVLGSVTGTALGPGVTAARNDTWTPSAGDIEPSVVTETPVQPSSTDILPTWTTSSSVTPSKFPTPRVTKRTPKTPKPVTSRSTPTPHSERTVVTLKPLDAIEIPVGKQFLFKIPDDMFRDYGTIQDLFIDAVHPTAPPDWIEVNRTSMTLYGLAFEEEHIGVHGFDLVAFDDQQRTIITPLTVRIDPPPPTDKASNEFSVTFDLEYEKVKHDPETIVNLINKIAAAFGDKDAGKMTILKISPGSVVITYTNNTLPSEPCPQKEVEVLLRYLLQPDGQINKTFAKAMEPYRITKAEGTMTGSCASESVSTTSSTVESITSQAKVTTSTPESEVDVNPVLHKSDGNLLYILLPLLIFFVLLVLIIIICIVCCKRQRKRQKEEDKLTGLHKGIPIIFAEELEDKPDTPASTLKSRSPDDEKREQHVPPPEYPTWKSSGSGSSTLRSDYKSPLLTDNEDDENKEDSGSTSPETLPRTRTQEENASTTEPLLHFKG